MANHHSSRNCFPSILNHLIHRDGTTEEVADAERNLYECEMRLAKKKWTRTFFSAESDKVTLVLKTLNSGRYVVKSKIMETERF